MTQRFRDFEMWFISLKALQFFKCLVEFAMLYSKYEVPAISPSA